MATVGGQMGALGGLHAGQEASSHPTHEAQALSEVRGRGLG